MGHVAHFFYKKEYQAPGAPHYHILLWIEDATDEPEDVLRWLQNRITCCIPEDSNPKLDVHLYEFEASQLHKVWSRQKWSKAIPKTPQACSPQSQNV